MATEEQIRKEKQILENSALVKKLKAENDYEVVYPPAPRPVPKELRAMFNVGKSFASNEFQYTILFNEKTQQFKGAVYFSNRCEGPVGSVHGGCTATVFDEIFGSGIAEVFGFGYFTVSLTVNYKKFVPLQSVVLYESEPVRADGRKLHIAASFRNPETNEIHATSTAIFYAGLKPVIMKDVDWEQVNKLTPEKVMELYSQRKYPTKQEKAKL